MKRLTMMALAAALACGGALAKTPTDSKEHDAKSATQVVCKDGAKLDVQTTRGACKGHGGIDQSASSSAETTRSSGAAGSSTSSLAHASAGGAGKVWLNESTHVYHCAGEKWYGKTKNGEYMTEAQAKEKGAHADHGKGCAS